MNQRREVSELRFCPLKQRLHGGLYTIPYTSLYLTESINEKTNIKLNYLLLNKIVCYHKRRGWETTCETYITTCGSLFSKCIEVKGKEETGLSFKTPTLEILLQ